MASSPRALILTGFGINCEFETAYALRMGGAKTEFMHFNQLQQGSGAALEDFQILALPGGFSFGDDIQSGRVLANKFKYKLHAPLKKFVDAEKPVLGICNGFQVLVQLGILPGWNNWERKMTLARNARGRFEERWVRLRSEDSACPFARHAGVLSMPVRHGEGQVVFSSQADLKQMQDGMQIVFRYADEEGNAASAYPLNPNGSADSIAGVCNPGGNVLGLMPHPECHLRYTQSPDWTANPPVVRKKKESEGVLGKLASALGLVSKPVISEPADEGNCTVLFSNLVEYARKF
ncbi:Phosphoribosylformylglycinamidine synthase subunit PurQ [uncultured archaeon]|nr:Phosphoribosylformylglycinamidine synthase subunit PurQ [uncultured archaeon]